MARPSLYQQVSAVAIDGRSLKPSPRCWNPGLFRYRDRLWLSYRYHLAEAGARCATAIVRLDDKTLLPVGQSQRIMIEGPTGTEHHEDARLFMFRGEPHISVTEMSGYRPGVDYTCRIRYARLGLQGNRWRVIEAFTPNLGENWNHRKEKNWIFFEAQRALWCIYRDAPDHEVHRIEGENSVEVHTSAAPYWPWGDVRGGTPPIEMEDGSLLAVFHSSVPSEDAPHYVRYYAGAYVMEGRAPFAVSKISRQPLMVGSEKDGHKVDPRYVEGWKPFVVFPGGLVRDGPDLLVALGVNDWQCAVARIPLASLDLMAADGTEVRSRYFRRPNGSMPVRVMDRNREAVYLDWLVPGPGTGCSVGLGYMELRDPRFAEEVAAMPRVEEIIDLDYHRALKRLR